MNALAEALLGGLAPVILLLTPFASAGLFLALTACVAVQCSRRRTRILAGWRRYLLLATLAFGGYTLFNVYDYARYRRCGLAISPINQLCYFLFLAPSDLYEPCARIALSPSQVEYSAVYRHRYGGTQRIALNVVNNEPKDFEYGNPDRIDLGFRCTVSCAATGGRHDFAEEFKGYYLLAGTNSLSICRYEIDTIKALRPEYSVKIKIDGDIAGFLGRYPGSFITVGNGTTK